MDMYPHPGILLLRFEFFDLFNKWNSKKTAYEPIASPKEDFELSVSEVSKKFSTDPDLALHSRILMFPQDADHRARVIKLYGLRCGTAPHMTAVMGVHHPCGSLFCESGVIDDHGQSPCLEHYFSDLWSKKRLEPFDFPEYSV